MKNTHTILDNLRYCIVKPTEPNAHPYAIACGLTEAYCLGDVLALPSEIVCDGSAYPVEAIDEHAFCGLNIATLHLPHTVREIRHHAFAGGKFRAVAGGQCVETIGTEAFNNCRNLSSFNFSNVREIGYRAFANTAFKRVKLGRKLRNIYADAFLSNSGYEIDSIELPASAKVLYSKAGFLKPNKLIFKPNNRRYICTDDIVVEANSGVLLWIRPGSPRTLHIPGYVRIMNEGLLPAGQEDVVVGSPDCPTSPTSSFDLDGAGTPLTITIYGEGRVYLRHAPSLRAVRMMSPQAVIRLGFVNDVIITYEVQPDANAFASSTFGCGSYTVEYSAAVEHVPMLRSHFTTLGENVKSIGKIFVQEAIEAPHFKHPEFKEEYTFVVSLTRCKQIPEIEEPDMNALHTMALIVPKGMKEAYANHPVWRYAAYIKEECEPIDDEETTLLRKREILDKISGVCAFKCAKMALPAGATVRPEGNRVHAEMAVLPISPFGNLKCCVNASIFVSSNLDFWEETRAKFESILDFVNGVSPTLKNFGS